MFMYKHKHGLGRGLGNPVFGFTDSRLPPIDECACVGAYVRGRVCVLPDLGWKGVKSATALETGTLFHVEESCASVFGRARAFRCSRWLRRVGDSREFHGTWILRDREIYSLIC